MDRSIRKQSPAKLNLSLAIGAPVPPKGYHPIASWFVPIDLSDELTLTALAPGAVSEHAIAWEDGREIDWPLEKDLAVRAHREVEQLVGRELPVRLTLRKRIPTGGGLGGGSSDAASMLIGLNAVCGLHLPHAALVEIATRLGSDIAFFIDERIMEGRSSTPRHAWVTGFGEQVRRIDGRLAGHLVLIFPPMPCPTADVYRAFDGLFTGAAKGDEASVPSRGAAERACKDAYIRGKIDPSLLVNDLTAAAYTAVPALAKLVRERIEPALGALAPRFGPLRLHMTGSGSTHFVILDPSRSSGGGPAELAAELERAVPGIRCLATRIV